MNWIMILLGLMLLIGTAEKSNHRVATKVRGSRAYQGSKRTLLDIGNNIRGRPTLWVNGQRATVDAMPTMTATSTPKPPKRPTGITYTPPFPGSPVSAGSAAKSSGGASNGVTVDFFQGLLMLVNAPYEGPNDALRQLRTLSEGSRQWGNSLTRLHQRMSDPGDMRIDPFVSDHVIRATSFFMAGTLELVESDTALTTLLNMTLAEIGERGLQVPNTKR